LIVSARFEQMQPVDVGRVWPLQRPVKVSLLNSMALFSFCNNKKEPLRMPSAEYRVLALMLIFEGIFVLFRQVFELLS